MSGLLHQRGLALATSLALLATVVTATAPAAGADDVDPDEWCQPTPTVLVPALHLWSQELLLQSDLTCDDTSLNVPDLTFQWGIEGVDPSLLDAATVNTASLHIPARPAYLDIGIDYEARLTVTYGYPFEGQTVQDEATFRYVHAPLVALIAGGSRNAYLNETITLDASMSYDPDAPDTPLPADFFSWEVRDLAGALLKTYEGVDKLQLQGPGWMQTDHDYLIWVTVTDDATGRSSSHGMTLSVYPEVIPSVSISAPQAIDPSERLRLQGAVTGLTSSWSEYHWSELTGQLSDADLVDPLVIVSRPNTALLVIRENVLDADHEYEFRLAVTDVSDGVGFATAKVTVAAQGQDQTITFDWHPDKTYGQGPIDLSGKATASSGLPVNYSASGKCSVSGGTSLSLTGAGDCTVTASQDGNGAYLPADPVAVTFTIKKAPLTITARDAERIDLMPNPDLDRVTYAGFVNGEDASVLTGSLSCKTDARKTSPPGDYRIWCDEDSDLNAANYWMDWQSGTLTIVYVAPITYEQKQVFSEDTTIRRDDVAVANVTVTDGTLKVEGTVDGSIAADGPGDVIVSGSLGEGHVKGNIVESGVGDLKVFDGALVDGNLAEQGGGSIVVSGGSRIRGNVAESYDGGVLIGGSGSVVEGGVKEGGSGDLEVRNGAVVAGVVCQVDPGTRSVDGTSSVGQVKCDE